MRIGQGYDIHPLKEGRPLILGGITIPHTHGLDGHSDADALTHAVCDALLGALGEGDLGTRFPSSNPAFKNMDSLVMLASVVETLSEKGYTLVNLDTVILAQAPKLAPYMEAMKDKLAKVLGVKETQVNVKVKSGEGIGMIGRAEGIAVLASCLIEVAQSS
ncbi:MAG: 2-C-methyl-D-erythritol 2,4-cyclodiphosphate synthase [Nitrospira sp.]|nr:2-C-methyl-D-erythritol 2,4-cyclodiphosphate synthase [Nitrospira sp.]MCA9481054.1 2-C-methyl-D-erythritol 2,4-cyclodiphosphate synthase [Nitrospira sp.]MCB9711287.1 2-C-methyl-D-erythritol 2,4-cyclodiphosphate synthase [Nitrospiraceae bacterium]MDR4486395.1 2-C-methyl-D-erythritol 2,4-cyclodiphosphate synthase [Nitrospirales bacterium]HQU28252.1 2-C-methyl-D-erythritol 2,4-cyclodiphosphate synthase [Nitrospirales bacterium]